MRVEKCTALIRRKCTHLFQCALLLVIVVFLLHPDRNARSQYHHLTRQETLEQLVPAVSTNLTVTNLVNCDYKSIIFDNTLMDEPLHRSPYSLAESPPILEGGEYWPKECKPLFSTAVVVPYRDRPEQLHAFLVHMHNFLRKQNIHYRIYVVEQVNLKPFNRAKLLNVGSVHAARAGFPCLVLHDVDLLPLHAANIYACTQTPRHMSAIINKFRYALPYVSLFGGAVSIQTSQFKSVNGMSNKYNGWGAEDDDFSSRISTSGLSFCRFGPEVSRYFMTSHRSETKGANNDALLFTASDRFESDGLNSLQYSEVATVLHPLFTHVMIDF